MTRFAILLGGPITVTPRLLRQIAGARVIAADGGMAHAAALGVTPELWVGDFDSTGRALAREYPKVERQTHPAAKDATDGALAMAEALRRGASELVLVGGLGGQTDHMLGNLGVVLRLALQGHRSFITSGTEEAHPIVPGEIRLDLPPASRLSLIPFSDLEGLDIEGVKWPLDNRSVELGSTLTLSNETLGKVRIRLKSGHAIAIARPADGA